MVFDQIPESVLPKGYPKNKVIVSKSKKAYAICSILVLSIQIIIFVTDSGNSLAGDRGRSTEKNCLGVKVVIVLLSQAVPFGNNSR